MGGVYVKKRLTSEKCSVYLYIIMCIRSREKKQSLCICGKKKKDTQTDAGIFLCVTEVLSVA